MFYPVFDWPKPLRPLFTKNWANLFDAFFESRQSARGLISSRCFRNYFSRPLLRKMEGGSEINDLLFLLNTRYTALTECSAFANTLDVVTNICVAIPTAQEKGVN